MIASAVRPSGLTFIDKNPSTGVSLAFCFSFPDPIVYIHQTTFVSFPCIAPSHTGGVRARSRQLLLGGLTALGWSCDSLAAPLLPPSTLDQSPWILMLISPL